MIDKKDCFAFREANKNINAPAYQKTDYCDALNVTTCENCHFYKNKDAEALKRRELMEVVGAKTEVVKFDGVYTTTVYTGSFEHLRKANLKWRVDKDSAEFIGFDLEILRLSEIVEQLKNEPLITVFINRPLGSQIWQYGNYGDGKWYVIAEGSGYA